MDRLQRKCLLGSAAFHLLLTAILLVGPAFLSRKEGAAPEPVLTFIPDTLVDEDFSNLGPGPQEAGPPPTASPTPLATSPTPPAKQAEPQQPPPTSQSAPKDIPPTPQKEPETKPQPEPPPPQPLPKEAPAEKPKPQEKTPPPDPAVSAEKKPKDTKPPKKAPIVVNLTPKRIYPADNAAKRAEADAKAKAEADRQAKKAADRAAEQYQSRVRGTLDSIAKQSAARTDVMSGISVGAAAGGGGVAGEIYASYKSIVFSVYVHAWTPPPDVEDQGASVEAQVTIARDGSVIQDKTHITRRSNIPALNRSVQEALNRVNFIAPFPASSTDSQRTFIIGFNLKAKSSLG